MIQLKENISLEKLNTFHINAHAKFFAEFSDVAELKEIISGNSFRESDFMVLGGGSNVLFTGNFDGLILKNCIKGISIVRENEDHVWIKAGSGEVWHHLVQFAIENNLGGIENLSLIPGSVGAGPMQNIGAYGAELKDTFSSLDALIISSGEIKSFDKSECHFGYRTSIFKTGLKDKAIITSVTLRLLKHPVYNTSYGAITTELERMGVMELNIRAISEAVCNIRRSKLPDPEVLGNAGSFFKNPEVSFEKYSELKLSFPVLVAYPTQDDMMKLAAGWLIEQCGWKGKRIGNTGAHKDQALVLVNYGDATGKEIFDLSEKITQSVKEKFGVVLDREVNII